ncbi:MAG: hypothetical protein RH947_13010 [Alcanivorax sp.]
MKICQVWGDLSSDKASENYPTDLFCDECFELMGPGEEDSDIVTYDEDNGEFGDTCSSCGKTRNEEEEE